MPSTGKEAKKKEHDVKSSPGAELDDISFEEVHSVLHSRHTNCENHLNDSIDQNSCKVLPLGVYTSIASDLLFNYILQCQRVT